MTQFAIFYCDTVPKKKNLVEELTDKYEKNGKYRKNVKVRRPSFCSHI
jgi:hypothetical protein